MYVLSVANFCSYPYNAALVCKFVMIKQKEKKVKHDLVGKKRLPLHCNNGYVIECLVIEENISG